MKYEITSDGSGGWVVKENGAFVPGAYVKRVEFDEGYVDGPNGRTYHVKPGSGRGLVRLPNGIEISSVPLT